jgi:opacity protein-like surface antigen
MKRNLLALTVASLCVLQLQAQNKTTKTNEGSGVYIQLHGGYGLQTNPFGGEGNTEKAQSESSFDPLTTTTYKKGGYGKGINVGITFGKEMSENIALELGASYFLGSKQTINTFTNSFGYEKNELSATIINIVPSLVIKTSNEDGANLYAKFGPAIGIGGKIKTKNEKKLGTDIAIAEGETSKGISIGIQSALGLDYPVSDKLSIIAELNFRDQKLAPKEGSVTKYTINGQDRLSSLSVSDKQIEFVNELTSNDNADDNKPTKQLKQYSSLSSLGLNIGIRLKF